MLEHELFELAARLQRDGVDCAMATVIGVETPSSARVGYRALITGQGEVHGWVGGGCVQPAVLKCARQVLLDGGAQRIRVVPEAADDAPPGVLQFPMSCESGGSVELLIEAIEPCARLVIFGDSPVARATARFAAGVGFCVEVVAHAAAGEFPDARRVIDPAALDTLPTGAYVIVATQGGGDFQALQSALGLDPGYLGFVASRRKAAALLVRLRDEAGVCPGKLGRIVAPAGLPMPARTPEEIGLSVVAGLVAHRRSAQHTDADAAPVSADVSGGCCGDAAASTAAAVPAIPKSCCGG